MENASAILRAVMFVRFAVFGVETISSNHVFVFAGVEVVFVV